MSSNHPKPSSVASSLNTNVTTDPEQRTPSPLPLSINEVKKSVVEFPELSKAGYTNHPSQHHHIQYQNSADSVRKQIYIEEHKSDMVANLNRFRNENSFTDIFIYVEGVEFPCHKVVLCAASCYFKAMFSCDLKESRQGKVFVENISPWTMKRILDFIYTGKIEINYENVIEIFNAAVMFQLGKLASKCSEFINDHIDLTNCIEILVFSSMHQLERIEAATFQFILDNFMQVINFQSICISKTTGLVSSSGTAETTDKSRIPGASAGLNDHAYFGDFVRLSEETFSNLIKSDSLNVSREIYVYYALKKWMDYRLLAKASDVPKVINQKQTYESLFKNVRLNALTQNELDYILDNDEMVQENENLAELIRYHLKEKIDSNSSSGSVSVAGQKNKLPLENISHFKDNDVVTSKNDNTNPSTSTCSDIQANSQNQSKDTNSALESINPQTSTATTSNIILNHNNNNVSSSSTANTTKLARFRPSTIPRDYMCLLKSNQFQYYDFFKSKWDVLNSWPPAQNPSNSKRASQSSDYCNNLFSNTGNSEVLDAEVLNAKPRCNFGGYSTVIINNILYVIGGYTLKDDSSFNNNNANSFRLGFDNQRIELMNQVWRYDPIKNEWTKCAPMLRRRAFHISISLETTDTTNMSASMPTSTKKNRFIFLFYGFCSASEDSGQQPLELNAFPLKQCLAIDIYSLEADQWSKLKNNDSLLDHHIFQSINNQNRLILTGPDSMNSETSENQESELNLNLLNQLIQNQLAQSKLVISLKNLIYILKENCIHCYEFDAKLEQLICLPYFRLPEKLSTFVLAAAVPSDTTPPAIKSLFTWHCDESDLSPKDSFELENECLYGNDPAEESKDTFKEALIYLLNMQLGVLYQFYPAKNKLKKLPNLLLKHTSNETSIICMKSKLYVTGGLLPKPGDEDSAEQTQDTGTAIEEYDDDKETWTLYMNSTEARVSPTTSSFSLESIETGEYSQRAQGNRIYELQRFFKLKMALV